VPTNPSAVALIQQLVAAVPAFEEMYENHVSNYDEVLPTVFLEEVRQSAVASFQGAAQKAEGGTAIFGGSFKTLRVRPLGSPMESGVPFNPCEESCKALIGKLCGTY